MVLPFLFPALLILFVAGREKAKNPAGKCPPPDSDPFSDAEYAKNLAYLSRKFAALPNRRFKFHKSHQFFIRTHNKTGSRRRDGALSRRNSVRNCEGPRFTVARGTANRTQPATQSNTQSFAADRIGLRQNLQATNFPRRLSAHSFCAPERYQYEAHHHNEHEIVRKIKTIGEAFPTRFESHLSHNCLAEVSCVCAESSARRRHESDSENATWQCYALCS
jgi:hypothetical protein